MSDISCMNGRQFIENVRRIGRHNGVVVTVEENRGKGSHVTLWYGARYTVVKDRRKDIGTGLFRAMCEQIDLDHALVSNPKRKG